MGCSAQTQEMSSVTKKTSRTLRKMTEFDLVVRSWQKDALGADEKVKVQGMLHQASAA